MRLRGSPFLEGTFEITGRVGMLACPSKPAAEGERTRGSRDPSRGDDGKGAEKTAVRDLVSADGAKGFPRTIRYDGMHGEGLSSDEGFPRSCARFGGVGRFGDSPDVRRVPSGPRRLRHGFAWFSASCRTMTRQGPVQPRGHVPLRQGRCGGDAEAAKRCRRAANRGTPTLSTTLGTCASSAWAFPGTAFERMYG